MFDQIEEAFLGRYSAIGCEFFNSNRRVAWVASVYHVWLHRNARIYNGALRTKESVLQPIKRFRGNFSHFRHFEVFLRFRGILVIFEVSRVFWLF